MKIEKPDYFKDLRAKSLKRKRTKEEVIGGRKTRKKRGDDSGYVSEGDYFGDYKENSPPPEIRAPDTHPPITPPQSGALVNPDDLPDGHFFLPSPWPVFTSPFTMMVAGPSGSGKSTFVRNLIKFRREMIYPTVQEIRWYHCQPSSFHHRLMEEIPGIQIIEGLPDSRDFDPAIPKLVVLDDMMHEISKNAKKLAPLFTKISHHTNSCIIFITQNVFMQNKEFRTASVNTQHLIIMKNPRDVQQISTIQTQMFGKKTDQYSGSFLSDIYKFATKKPHSYILAMTDQYTPNELRVRSHIFPGEDNLVYGL